MKNGMKDNFMLAQFFPVKTECHKELWLVKRDGSEPGFSAILSTSNQSCPNPLGYRRDPPLFTFAGPHSTQHEGKCYPD